jgi:hypothetical protein
MSQSRVVARFFDTVLSGHTAEDGGTADGTARQ